MRQGAVTRRRLALAALLSALLAAAWADGALAQGNPFAPGARPQAQPQTQSTPQAAAPAAGGWFADVQRQVNRQLNQRLAEINKGSPAALLLGALLAFAYGVFHAAGPGHGKMLVVSYFIGRDSHPWRGALMGSQIALVHVGGAIVLALIATAIMTGAAPPSPEDMREVKLASYAAVAAIGAWMLASVLRGKGYAHFHGHHDHAAHGHAHDHGYARDHDHGPGRGHARDKGQGRGSAMISLVAGAVPCTGAVLVLIYCIANGIPATGLGLVLMIGLGMAVTLTAFGLFGMFARRRALAFAARGEKTERPARWRRGLDLIGPGLILGLGVALFVGAY